MQFINIPKIAVQPEGIYKDIKTPIDVGKYILISIVETETEVVPHKHPDCVDILRLHFSDITEDMLEASKNMQENEDIKPFTDQQAKDIIDFVQQYNGINTCYIHCTAGVSRSAGVAGALSKYYNGNDQRYFDRYIPNMFIYQVILNELYGKEL